MTRIGWLGHLLLLGLICPLQWACPLLEELNAQVAREVDGLGLHRGVRTVVWLSGMSAFSSDGVCHLLLLETVPNGAYLDPDELARLQEYGQVPSFKMSEEVSVEAGAWHSHPTKVLLYPIARPIRGGQLLINITMPWHLRYHRARAGSAPARVRLEHPEVYVSCSNLPESCLALTNPWPCLPTARQEDPSSPSMRVMKGGREGAPSPYEGGSPGRGSLERGVRTVSGGTNLKSDAPPSCLWLPVHSFSTTDGVVMEVAVGNTEHLEPVLLATCGVTSAAALLLVAPALRRLRGGPLKED